MSSISMHPSAKYVTQSSIFDCPKLGRLTNRKIEEYRRRGFYATGHVDAPPTPAEVRARNTTTARKRANQWAKQFMKGLLE